MKKQEIEKKSGIISKTQNEINLLNEKINNISNVIQKSSGFEQDTLLSDISELKQEIAGISARKENFENQLNELDRRKNMLTETIKTAEIEISEMSKEKGKNHKKELEEKKAKLEGFEEAKRQYYLLKSNISSLNNQIEDKKRQTQRVKDESNFILNQIEQIESEIKIKENSDKNQEALINLKHSLNKNRQTIIDLEKSLLENEKIFAVKTQEIQKAEKINVQVSKIDICPLCKTKMTGEHMKEVSDKTNKDISNFKKILSGAEKEIRESSEKINELKEKIIRENKEINVREINVIKFQTIEDKKQQLKRNREEVRIFELELEKFEKKQTINQAKFSHIKSNEEGHEMLKLEVNELQRSEERNLGGEITIKQRELERTRVAIKQVVHDREEISEELVELGEVLEEKQEIVEEKEEQSEIVKRKYQKMFAEKNVFQDKVRMFESNLMKQQNEKRIFENEVNDFAILRAQINAKYESLLDEIKEFEGVEFINLSMEKLCRRLQSSEDIFSRIGNVNLRALEVYDDIKAEYDKIKEKVEQLDKEKEEILKIIEQIDRKKKKAFLQTLNEVNDLFSRNFSNLSEKGIVTLEPQNKKEVFDAGIDIIVKVGGGKYFDVTSLSGGEQCLVALSLIFAIQEFSPYCFYIFDEIDAALDRRNSEKLAYLLKRYMKNGQYLIITHNDSIISESSSVLYGVSMQEGISKVLSLEV